MRIVYLITTSQPIGGAQVHVRHLATRLHEVGHDVTVLVGGEPSGTPLVNSINVRYLSALRRPINPLFDVRAYAQIREVLRELRPDLLSTHSSKAGWLGRLAGNSLRIPTIFTAHGWAFSEGIQQPGRTVYLCAERVVAPLASKIITVSEYDRNLALRYHVAMPDKLVTVHNGVPDVASSLRARPELEPPRLVMIARFSPQKDHAALLYALRELQHLPWSLDLVGSGEDRARVERLALELGLSQRIRFLGARQDVAEILAGAQVFILASHWEGFPRSILEAMRAGLPVIASNVGGVREAVIHGKTGLLVPRGDVPALREAIEALLINPDSRIRMGELGRKRYEAHFTFDRMVEETLAVYESVLAELKL